MARVEIYFVTNRNCIQEGPPARFGAHFNVHGVAALRFGKAILEVTRNGADRSNDTAAILSVTAYKDPEPTLQKTDLPPQGSSLFLEDLRQEMLNDRDTLVFIHGFNVSFEEALDAGGLLADSLEGKQNVVVFSWPSDGEQIPYMSYYSDREDARASGPALARAYLKLFEFMQELRETELKNFEEASREALAAGLGAAGIKQVPPELCGRSIHVLAHSMGNYLLRQGLQALRVKDPRHVVRMFDQVIMAAPDEDDDAFEHDDKLRLLPTLARRVTVYHNRRDRALVISDKTKSNPDRLGSEGPRMLDLLPKKVVIVDCSQVAKGADPLSLHSYYIRSSEVASDIALVLKKAEDNEDDDLELGNRVTIREGRAYRLPPANRDEQGKQPRRSTPA